ncbi:MAG: sigma factor, partial [Myxococcaceae bacterium]
MRYFPLADADAAKRAWHLALQHVSVARRVSWRLVRRTPALRPYLEDLIQEATVGMYRAALTYAPERCAFETWAWWWASCFARRAARAALNPMSGRPRGEPLSRLAPDPLESHREPTSTSLNAELVAEAHL